MDTEEKIEELKNKIKELEAREAENRNTIITMNYTIGLMVDAIENNANLISKLITVIGNIEKIIG